jgi:hypothetical protein
LGIFSVTSTGLRGELALVVPGVRVHSLHAVFVALGAASSVRFGIEQRIERPLHRADHHLVEVLFDHASSMQITSPSTAAGLPPTLGRASFVVSSFIGIGSPHFSTLKKCAQDSKRYPICAPIF